MQDWLTARAAVSPQRLAVSTIQDGGLSALTYRQLDEQAGVMAARLLASGLRPGDRLGIGLPAGPAYVALLHAVIRLGLVLVPLNTRLTPSEVAWQVDKAGCRLLITAGDHDSPPAACQTLTLPALQNLPTTADQRDAAQPGALDLNTPAVIVFTSGTTGQPKGAVLTLNNLFHSAMASAYRIGVLPQDRWLCTLPLYHVGGLSILLRSCLYGTAVELHPRFAVEAVDEALATRPNTLVSLVPTMLHRLLEAGTPDRWAALRLILLGGAAATSDLLEWCFRQGIPVATTYGLTEAASQVATAAPDEAHRKPGSVGKPLLFTQVSVVDGDGRSVPAGTYGEVVVRGPTVMQGYDGDPAATASVFRDGGLHTGDIGYLDDDGDLWLVQRRSDLIVTGGENVYPAEVEAVLRRHPAVAEVCIVGLDHPEWGQQVAAAVEVWDGETVDVEALLAHSRRHLAGYKQPRRVICVDALPRTASGKIARQQVVELFQ